MDGACNEALATWLTTAALVLSNGVIALILAKAKIALPLRKWVDAREWEFFSELIRCPLCLSVWFAVVTVAIWQPRFTYNGFVPALDWLISVFAVSALSSLVSGYLQSLYE